MRRKPVVQDVADDGSVIVRSIRGFREAENGCRRCPLYKNATQAVPGEGPAHAAVMMVGEQPGDKEDLAGKPFVGPAGKLLDRALEEAGIDRGDVYVTNAVKHFKFEPRGKRRIHSKPNAGEIDRCKWWLDQELSLIKPRVVVALGATAARSLFGKSMAIGASRGRALTLDDGTPAFVTTHPSALLRVREEDDRAAQYKLFVVDLRRAAAALRKKAA
jgi:uracil-DNA glycosylase family protein